MRLPWIYTITAKTELCLGGVCVHGHTWLMLSVKGSVPSLMRNEAKGQRMMGHKAPQPG